MKKAKVTFSSFLPSEKFDVGVRRCRIYLVKITVIRAYQNSLGAVPLIGCAHGDLSLTNLILTSDNSLRIIDGATVCGDHTPFRDCAKLATSLLFEAITLPMVTDRSNECPD